MSESQSSPHVPRLNVTPRQIRDLSLRELQQRNFELKRLNFRLKLRIVGLKIHNLLLRLRTFGLLLRIVGFKKKSLRLRFYGAFLCFLSCGPLLRKLAVKEEVADFEDQSGNEGNVHAPFSDRDAQENSEKKGGLQ